MADLGNLFVNIGTKFDETGAKKASKFFGGFVITLGDVVNVGKKVLGFATSFVQAAGEQERATLTLAQAMRQAGTFTEAALKHNLDYASSLQRMTEYGDEAISGVQRMLTNFGIEGKELDDLTRATLDLAAAKKMDLAAAADLVAKSVGSSTNALTRYGIEVKGAVGSTERAQTAVENITRIFGGAAKANAETYLGQITQLTNRWGDIKEAIGAAFIPVLMQLFDVISTKILPPIEKWLSNADNLKVVTTALGTTLEWLIKIGASVFYTFRAIAEAVHVASQGIVGLFTLDKRLIAKSISSFEQLKNQVGDYYETVRDMDTGRAQSYAETEQAITETDAIQSEARLAIKEAEITAQTELDDAQSEQNMARKANEVAFIEAQEAALQEQREKRELAIRRFAEDTSTMIIRGIMLVADTETLTWRSGTKAFGQAVKERLSYFVQSETQQLIAAKIRALAEAIFNSTITFGAASAQIGIILGAFAVGIAGLRAIQSFGEGGIVPGRIGSPQLAMVHGGETILPTHKGGAAGMNITINIPAITTRREALRLGEVVGGQIMQTVRMNRKI